jgi:PIN domain nuclease of toxin-antitoxin system
MRVLLDTHAFLWWVLNDPQLSARCRQIIADPANTIYISAAVAWEIAIKAQLGKLTLSDTPEVIITDQIQQNNFQVLPITLQHTLHTYTMPLHHRDPFDRILAAQSHIENLPIVTIDALISQYGVSTIW